MKFNIKCLFTIFLLLVSFIINAQPTGSNPSSNSNQNPYSYDSYDKYIKNKGYDPNQFNYYNPQDTFNLDKQVSTNPNELRKIGVDEESISRLLRLKSTSDSLKMLKKRMAQMEEEKLKLEFARYGLRYNSSRDTTLLEYIDLVELQKWQIIEKALKLPLAVVHGQEFFRRNKLRIINQNTFTKVPESYVISTGDEINISIYGGAEYNDNLVVDETGSIKTAVVGYIYVKGLTVAKARQVIKSRLSSTYNLQSSTVEVRVSSAATVMVNVVGDVFNPGTYKMSSSNTVFNILVEMEGPTQTGSLRKIYVKRDGKTIKTLDVYKYLIDPTANMDYFIENNDYIVVPPQGNIVSIAGAIKKPFKYEMLDNEGLLDLIKYAGGYKANAYKEYVTIRRFTDKDIKYFSINIDSVKRTGKDFKLINGDSIYVNVINNIPKNYVFVQGNGVTSAGNYSYSIGDKVSDAIRKAGGLAERAYQSTAFIIRFNKDLSKKILHVDIEKALAEPYSEANVPLFDRDTIQVFSSNTFRTSYRVGVYGAVNIPGEFDFAEDITIRDIILMGGGLKVESGDNLIEIYRIVNLEGNRTNSSPTREKVFETRISKDRKIDAYASAYKLKPYDQVFIRRKPYYEMHRTIKINGEVVYPGEYPLNNTKETLYDMIIKAGGLTDFAYIEGIKVFRKSDLTGNNQISIKIKDLKSFKNSKHNIVLSFGDSIIIPTFDQVIIIKGAVNYCKIGEKDEIKVPYDGRKSAYHYIEKYAGGFSREASRRNTSIVQPGGKAERPTNILGLKNYPIVENGATIIVPMKFKYEHPELWAIGKYRNKKETDWAAIIAPIATSVTTIITLLIATNNK